MSNTEEKQYHTGRLEIRENNNMSLSCCGRVDINNGIIRYHSLKGMPRSKGDGWVSFFQNRRIGDWVDEDKIKSMLKWNGPNNVKATFVPDSEVTR